MQRRCAAGRDQNAGFDIVAVVGRMHAGGVRHVLVDDLDHSGGAVARQSPAAWRPRAQCVAGARLIERHGAARKQAGASLGEHEIAPVTVGRRPPSA